MDILVLDVQKDDIHLEVLAWTGKIQPFVPAAVTQEEDSDDGFHLPAMQLDEEETSPPVKIDSAHVDKVIRKPSESHGAKLTKVEYGLHTVWAVLRLLSYLPWEPNNY